MSSDVITVLPDFTIKIQLIIIIIIIIIIIVIIIIITAMVKL